MTLEEKILAVLDEKKISYEVFAHDPVYTNPAMAEALNVSESETVKSLVLTTKEGNMIVLVLPGNKKVKLTIFNGFFNSNSSESIIFISRAIANYTLRPA